MFNPDGRAEQVTDKQLDEGMAVWVRSAMILLSSKLLSSGLQTHEDLFDHDPGVQGQPLRE
jgi:hypothetical protein